MHGGFLRIIPDTLSPLPKTGCLMVHHHAKTAFVSLRIAVMTVSDSRTEENDTSGKTLVEKLTAAGHQLAEKRIVADDVYQVRAVVSAWIADPEIHVVITTGGTGLTGRDSTPEALQPLYDKHIEGFGELFRHLSYAEIGASTIQSRAIAGIANGTVLFSLPGSSGACRTGWEQIIVHQLDGNYRPCNLIEIMPRMLEHLEKGS